MVNEEDRPVLSPDEQIAEDIAQDRRSAQYNIKGMVHYDPGMTFSTSLLHPGAVVAQDSGGDPILLNPEAVSDLLDWLKSIQDDTISYPTRPRRCFTCEQEVHVDGCEQIAWDTTPGFDHRN